MSADRGSVLVLMPAGVLVLVMLAALAVDASLLFLAERQLSNATAAAANDAAVAGLDEAAFYTRGVLRLDPARAAQVARASFGAVRAGHLHDVRVDVDVAADGTPRVRVAAEATVTPIFAKAIPGARRLWRVDAASTATARMAPPGG